MFTLKLYRNGPLPPDGRSVVMEVAGLWIGHCSYGIKHVRTFKKKVGVQDEDGGHDFYVGGDPQARRDAPNYCAETDAICTDTGGNYFDWGVLENAQGKTTEMLR